LSRADRCPAGIDIEAAPEKYYRPPYVGGAGWVGVELPRVSDKDLKMHLHEAWRLIAPAKLQDMVPASAGESAKTETG
jgi:hypothetical protein